MDPGGIVCTAPGNDGSGVDFVSRFFTPQCSVFEDPVTGSAHCTLTPYWSTKLGKDALSANQISPRKGQLLCRDLPGEDAVSVKGRAVTYLRGAINV